jgi:hypothetical protein
VPADTPLRIALVLLSRLFNWRDALVVVQPQTLIRWHRQRFRLFWHWKSRPGRPPIPVELRQLIRAMSMVCYLCRIFNTTISTQGAPHYLSSDNDPLFRYHRWQGNLRILEIRKIKSIPYTPVSHPFVERLIGTIRREYEVSGGHQPLPATLSNYLWISDCNGLFRAPIAA